MIKRKKGIGFTILLSLPPSPPPLSIFELAEELYENRYYAANQLMGRIRQLREDGWKIIIHKYGYCTIDLEHRDLLLRYCRVCRPEFPSWPKGLKLTPENVTNEVVWSEKHRRETR